MCENVIISLKIIYMVNVTSLCNAEMFQGRGQSPLTAHALLGNSLAEIQRRHHGCGLIDSSPRERRFAVAFVTKQSPKKTSVRVRLFWTYGLTEGATHRDWGSDTCRWRMGGHAFRILAARQFPPIPSDEQHKKSPLLPQVLRLRDRVCR